MVTRYVMEAGRYLFPRESERLGRALINRNTATRELMSALSKSHVYHELAFGRVTGNVSPACRILRQHDAACRESAHVTIACLKFYLAG